MEVRPWTNRDDHVWTQEKTAVCSPRRGASKRLPARASISASGLQEGEDPRCVVQAAQHPVVLSSIRRKLKQQAGPGEGEAVSTETEAVASEGGVHCRGV